MRPHLRRNKALVDIDKLLRMFFSSPMTWGGYTNHNHNWLRENRGRQESSSDCDHIIASLPKLYAFNNQRNVTKRVIILTRVAPLQQNPNACLHDKGRILVRQL
jgi:hypothetical protein